MILTLIPVHRSSEEERKIPRLTHFATVDLYSSSSRVYGGRQRPKLSFKLQSLTELIRLV